MSYDTTNPGGAKALLDGGEGWTFLDVRTVEEFQAGHVPGAYNAPIAFHGPGGMELNDGFVAAVAAAFPPETPLVLGCAAGVRSARACEMLAAAGFRKLVNMDGGFSGSRTTPGWIACGHAISREAEPEHTWAEIEARAAK